MNYDMDGELIAKIEGTKKKLYITGDDGESTKREIDLTGTQRFQVTFNPDLDRQIFAIFGSSGSGKSYFARQLCREYYDLHKKNQIYLFSPVVDDPSLDSIKNLAKIDISNPEFLNEEVTLLDLENSLVIFDDCESISNKMVNKKCQVLAEMLLERGRHHKISVLFLNHTPCNGKQTKKLLQESHGITIFKTLQGRNLKYLLENYLSLDNKQIKIVKGLKKQSRALTFMRTFPMVVVSEKKAVILDDD